jgi:DNA-binding NarL/FixJ family response regulator
MSCGLHLSDDLLFSSRVAGEARALGRTVKPVRSLEQLYELMRQEAPSCLVVDLAFPGLDLSELLSRLSAASVPPRVVAYGSHVDTERLRAARAAGCDPVLPRSKFVEELPQALPKWLSRDNVGEEEASRDL